MWVFLRPEGQSEAPQGVQAPWAGAAGEEVRLPYMWRLLPHQIQPLPPHHLPHGREAVGLRDLWQDVQGPGGAAPAHLQPRRRGVRVWRVWADLHQPALLVQAHGGETIFPSLPHPTVCRLTPHLTSTLSTSPTPPRCAATPLTACYPSPAASVAADSPSITSCSST